MMDLSPEARTALAELRAAAGRPLGDARAMPPALYNSEEIYRLEIERIFNTGWICPGFAADIPNIGDYITYSIAAQPVFVIRDQMGRIRTFSNVCRHRMMILLEGRGNVRRPVCPYHAWTYDLDGRLVGAGRMQRTSGFDKSDYCLPEIRTEVWNGWIYITLNLAAPSVADLLAPLQSVVERYGMADYVPVIRQDQVWATNWKILTENFMEGYHGPVVHRSTVGAGMDLDETAFPNATYEGFTYSTFTKPETAQYGRAHPDNRRLESDWRRTSVLPTVFPAHMYSLAPDYLWYLSLRPQGPGELQVRIGVALAPEIYASIEDRPAFIASMTEFFDKVNGEDKQVVERVYRGTLSPLAAAGPLSWLEREIHDFISYLSRKLATEPVHGA